MLILALTLAMLTQPAAGDAPQEAPRPAPASADPWVALDAPGPVRAAPDAPDPMVMRQRCVDGEAFEGEALPACIDRMTARERAAAIHASRLEDACRNRPRLPGETVEACVARRSAAEQATRAAVTPLPPQAPLPAAWAEPRPQQRCRRDTYRQEGGGGVTFTCTTGDDTEASRAAQDMLRDMMRPRD